MTPPSPLSLTPLTAASIPTLVPTALIQFKSTLLTHSLSLLQSVSTPPWKPGKTFNKRTHPTLSHAATKPPGSGDTEGYKWHARRSKHAPTDGLQWENVRDALLVEHSTKEQRYIESCVEAKRIEVFEEGVLEVWQMSYALPFPTSNRDFVILVYTHETTPSPTPSSSPYADSPRSFIVVSIPFQHLDAPVRKGYVRGKYVSVEEVKEEKRGGDWVWTMATASDPNGLVPKWITELVMPSKISEDVPSLINWLKKQKPTTA